MDNLRHFWYNQIYILLELVKCSKYRETTFLGESRVRCCNIGKVDYLKSHFEAFHFFKKNLNVYYSLAIVKDMPMFSFAPQLRKEQQKEFNENFEKRHFIGYDFGLDFDGNKEFDTDLAYLNGELIRIIRRHYGKEGVDSIDILQNGIEKPINSQELKDLSKDEMIQRAKKDVLKLKKELDNYKIQYSIKFSGNKGFHLNIPNEVLPDIEPIKKVAICERMTREFSKILNLPTIDTKLMSPRRIWSLPYSLKGENVVLPLDDKQLNNFKIEDMKAFNVLSKVKIMNRGLLERNNGISVEDKRENFQEMMKDYEVL